MRTSRWLLALLGGLVAGLAIAGTAGWRWKRAETAPVSTEELPTRHWEATIYWPLQDNAGKKFAPEIRARALTAVILEFGGLTLGQEYEGCWLDGQKQIRHEPIQFVLVSFPQGQMGRFRRAMSQVGELLHQEALYVRFEEPRVELINISPKKAG